MSIEKTIIDNIIIVYDDAAGQVLRMEKMINCEEMAEYVSDVEKVLQARFIQKMTFPVESIQTNLIRFLRERDAMAVMLRFDFSPGQVIYSFGLLDENIGAEDPNFKENGFFVYEQMGVIYFRKP